MGFSFYMKKVSEYYQEIAQSHSADQPTALWGRAATRTQEDKQSFLHMIN